MSHNINGLWIIDQQSIYSSIHLYDRAVTRAVLYYILYMVVGILAGHVNHRLVLCYQRNRRLIYVYTLS